MIRPFIPREFPLMIDKNNILISILLISTYFQLKCKQQVKQIYE
jgi:hypothetical protein